MEIVSMNVFASSVVLLQAIVVIIQQVSNSRKQSGSPRKRIYAESCPSTTLINLDNQSFPSPGIILFLSFEWIFFSSNPSFWAARGVVPPYLTARLLPPFHAPAIFLSSTLSLLLRTF